MRRSVRLAFCSAAVLLMSSGAVFAQSAASTAGTASTAAATPSAASAALEPQIIDLAAIKAKDVGPLVPNAGTIRSRTLVNTPSGTVALQSGDAPRHTHNESDEIQYVISGSGQFWLGDRMREVHAGDLIIIPKGTQHAGSHASKGSFKVIAIKLPPQKGGDFHLVK